MSEKKEGQESFDRSSKALEIELLAEREKSEQSIIEIVTECWRFSRLFQKVANRLDAGEASKYISQLRYFLNKMDDVLQRHNLKVVNAEGQLYEPGMAVTALNIDEFDEADELIVDQMSEPIIMGQNGLKRMGTVLLRRRD